jgi:voltage-gated potassium channel
MLESVPEVAAEHGPLLRGAEWAITVLFTIEYVLRIVTSPHPVRYMRSFFGIVDLISLVPTYLSFFVGGTQVLTVVRSLRLLRVFRILKLARFVQEAHTLGIALRNSLRKITVFMGAVVTLIVILGAVMYLVEGERGSFSSVPKAMYWAIVTMTTVGYGDIVPTTTAGKFVASAVMLLGYGILAVPTGIVSAEISAARVLSERHKGKHCPNCTSDEHDLDAQYCKLCAAKLS